MTKLGTLRSQLAALRHRRQSVRWGTGLAALVVAVVWTLAGVFVLDLAFQLDVIQRVVLFAVAAAVVGWAVYKFSLPFWGVREDDLEMALLVERQQQIDSDLVAALQFESPQAQGWGSVQLERAVIDYVSDLGRGLNVFEGFSQSQLMRRALTLAVSLAVALGAGLLFREHFTVFANRLLLGSLHYPTRTVIERLAVNAAPVLKRDDLQLIPSAVTSPQGRPVVFAAWCTGQLPADALCRLTSVHGGQRREVKLEQVERAALEAAHEAVAGKPPADEDGRQLVARTISAVTSFETRDVQQALESPTEHGSLLSQAAAALDAYVKDWPAEEPAAFYAGKLPRLVDEVNYTVSVGDAWTDPALVELIPLPVVEPTLTDISPDYARSDEPTEPADAHSLQRSVIEGSEVRVALECTNKKLREATLTLIDKQERIDYPLADVDGQGQRFALDAKNTPFERVAGPLRFELQVTDVDGLHLEVPLRGSVRLKADRPPRVTGSVVLRVVVPTARPEIEIRAFDDYGISQVEMLVEVVRTGRAEPTEAVEPQVRGLPITALLPLRPPGPQPETDTRVAAPLGLPVLTERLPIVGGYSLDLVPYQLQVGDEVRLTLSVTDYRGSLPGVTAQGEPVTLEIGDESDVYAAILEADKRSQEKVDELIKRQLGIGESP